MTARGTDKHGDSSIPEDGSSIPAVKNLVPFLFYKRFRRRFMPYLGSRFFGKYTALLVISKEQAL